MVFIISSPKNDDDHHGIESYFTLEKKLETAERALKLSEEKYMAVVQNSKDPIILHQNGTIKFVNFAAFELTGFNTKELLNHNITDFITPKYRQLVISRFQARINGQDVPDLYEIELYRKDGSTFPVEINTSIIKYDGSPAAVVFIRDITDRKKTQEALLNSLERLKAIFHGATDGILAIDVNTLKLGFANPRISEITGYPLNELSKLYLTDIHPKSEIPHVMDIFNNQVVGQISLAKEIPIQRKNKSIIYCDINSKLITINNNRYLVGFYRDITEQKHSHELLKESEEKFKILFEYAPDAYYLNDLEGKFIDGNRAAEKLIGYSKEDMIGNNMLELNVLPEDQIKKALSTLEKNLKGEPTGPEEFLLLDQNGEKIPVEISTYPIKIQDNDLVLGIARDVSERKRSEDELKRSEEKYRSLIDNLSDTVIECDSDGNFSYVSPQVMNIFGFTPEEIIGKNAFEFIHPADLEMAMDAMAKALRKNEIYNFEYRTKHKDGHYFYVSGSGKVINEEDGIRIVGVVRDITERKKWEDELHRSFSITRATLESTEDGILVVDNNNEIKIFNERLVDIWELDSELLMSYDNKKLNKLIVGKITDPFAFVEIQKELEAHHNVESFDTIEIKDGRILEVTSKPQYLGETIVGRVWSYRDITERKRAEEAIRNSEAKFRQFFENEPEYCYMVSPDGNIIDVNKAALGIMGYRKEELFNQSINKIYAPEELPKIKELFDKWLETGIIENEELNIITKSGEQRTILLSANGILDERGKLLHSISVQRDITERKMAQEELERTLTELERSNKELEQFAYIASHDLQEPLRMVSSYVELLKRRYGEKLSDEADDFINFAIEGTKRMQRLINDLLKYSRVSTRRKTMKITNTEIVLNDVILDLGLMIEDSGAMVTHNKLPLVKADEIQLGQVFQNLVSNALKYHGVENPRVHVSAEKRGNEWIFSVQDNGIGIDEKYEERVFQIFQQLHPKGKFPGTGIGLAVVKRIIERHSGRIWFESVPGSGTTFYFTIPVNELEELEELVGDK